jgi:hypothetical protein
MKRTRLALAATCGLLTAAFAEKPSDHAWQARWIGPAAPPAVDLNGAQWIWADVPGVDPTRNAPPGDRFFRRDLEVHLTAPLVSAVALFAADNHFKLSVNGREIGGGDSWQHPTLIDLAPALQTGSNHVLIRGNNDPDSGAINAAGLIGKIRLEYQGGAVEEIVTDASWQAAATADAAVWQPVKLVGPVGTAPWTAMVSTSSTATANLWHGYRKSFSLAAKPASATARIAVDSKYWLWVNGTLVIREGGVKRGPNPQDTYFDVVDLAPHLKAGDNQLALLAWYFGKDGFSHKSSGKAGLLFELDAGGTKVLSDASWKVLPHPAFGQSTQVPNFRLAESSVRFDARLDPAGWTAAGFDDAAWSSPSDFGPPPAAPWNRLWQRSIPQWKDFGLKDYTNAKELPRQGGGAPITAKLPYNAQITPWLKVSAPSGLLIKMGTDNTANEINAEYLTREGVQEFETPAWMSGHAVVYQIPAGVEILGLKYRESGYDTEFTGRFVCDNAFLNRLVVKCERTLYINMRDTFFDCPDRERAAWWGDIVIQLAQVFRTFDTRSHALIRKCMYNLANWQRPSKTMFSPIPAGNWDKELPQQMLASIGKYGFWTYYLHSGDKQAIADLYPHVKDYLSIWQTDGDGLIVHRSGENGWDWADWGENVDIRVLDQTWFCLALEGAASMADLLAKPDDAAAFRKQRESVVAATNAKFWNGSAYRDPGYGGATDDRAQGMAVVAGIAGPDKYPAIKKALAGSFHASPYIEKYILEALFLMGEPAAALDRMQSRYKEMVESETSTLWELFSRDGTLNHAWTGGPMTLLHEFVAGVVPTKAAYESYQVKPRLAGLKRVEVGFDTVKGRIGLKLAKQERSFHLALDSPAATKATVCIPIAEFSHSAVRVGDKTVWRNGKHAETVSGLVAGPAVEGHATFIVDPGKWVFEAR